MKHSLFSEQLHTHHFEKVYDNLCEGIVDEQKRGQLSNALTLALTVQNEHHHLPKATNVALTLRHLRADADTLIATLLSDPRLRDHLSIATIEDEFGRPIANIVTHIHWLNTFKDCTKYVPHAPEDAETLRRMLLATVDDIRAVLTKLAYRVERLRTISDEPPEVRRCIAHETMDVYSPLANRLGIAQLKWELEDLAFRQLKPDCYKSLAKMMEGKRVVREVYVQEFADKLLAQIKKIGVKANIFSRAKHLYSAWKKMQRKKVGIDDLADLLAVRVIVDTVPECYMVLGMAHNLWKHLPHEFDDYIANAKGNGYQSIHTAVIGPGGRIVEIQIRTKEMQEFAENGVAAHWRYKEGSQQDKAMDQTISELRHLLENLDESDAFLEDFHAELFSSQVFVMTPKGKVITLLSGATPLDFAYEIHSNLGHRSRGALVNGQTVPLTYPLQSGEKVEIITSERTQPSRDWMDTRLGFITTSRAKSAIKSWFNKQTYESHLNGGRRILNEEKNRLGLKKIRRKALAKILGFNHKDKLFIAIGKGTINPAKLAKALNSPKVSSDKLHLSKPHKVLDASPIIGVGNLETVMANCCQPVQGDAITGQLTEDNKVIIHRQYCREILLLPEEVIKHFIKVSWGESTESSLVRIDINAFDRQSLLMDITQILTTAEINTLEMNTRTDTNNQSVTMNLLIEVIDTEQLSFILDKIVTLPNVFDAKRSTPTK